MSETKIERVRRRMDYIADVRRDARRYRETANTASCGLRMEMGSFLVDVSVQTWIAKQLSERADALDVEADELEKSLEASIDFTAESA